VYFPSPLLPQLPLLSPQIDEAAADPQAAANALAALSAIEAQLAA
jgi:hypothetical protein